MRQLIEGGVECGMDTGKVVWMRIGASSRKPNRNEVYSFTKSGWIIDVGGDRIDYDRKRKIMSIPLGNRRPLECRKVYKDTMKQKEAYKEVSKILKTIS